MLPPDNKNFIDAEEAFKRNISRQIKKIRRQQGITQERFYKETSINIARLESGKIDIRLETLRKICTYFDVSLSGFFQSIWLQALQAVSFFIHFLFSVQLEEVDVLN